MRNIRLFIAIIFLLNTILVVSCKKNGNDSPATGNSIKTSRFKPCNCDNINEYIKGTFDGADMCFSTKAGGFTNDFDNAHYVDSSINLDQLNMIRQNSDRTYQVCFFWGRSKIWSRYLPYVLPRADWDTCEGAEIQLLRMNHPITSSGQFSDKDSINYVGHSGFGPAGFGEMIYTINEIKNDTLCGTFAGKMRTKTGGKINVENGEFRIRIIRSSGRKEMSPFTDQNKTNGPVIIPMLNTGHN
jgi:hypothetical protein